MTDPKQYSVDCALGGTINPKCYSSIDYEPTGDTEEAAVAKARLAGWRVGREDGLKPDKAICPSCLALPLTRKAGR